MPASLNGRYDEDDYEGAYSAGKALGIVLRAEIAPVVFLGADLAFRIVSQVFLDRRDSNAVHTIDGMMAAFIRGYHDGKRQG